MRCATRHGWRLVHGTNERRLFETERQDWEREKNAVLASLQADRARMAELEEQLERKLAHIGGGGGGGGGGGSNGVSGSKSSNGAAEPLQVREAEALKAQLAEARARAQKADEARAAAEADARKEKKAAAAAREDLARVQREAQETTAASATLTRLGL